MNSGRPRQTVEFGDFQTPERLATEVCSLLLRSGISPACVIEPTCGVGAFVAAAVEAFPGAVVRGFERNREHVEVARERVAASSRATVEVCDFFARDWDVELASLTEPLLVLGNPPWVTNATVGTLGGRNLPKKANVDGLRGIEALTGKANFDISEWMLRESLRWLSGRSGALAVLCKTSVARRVLAHGWSEDLPIESAAIHRLDASRDFAVAVDACLLVLRIGAGPFTRDCDVYESLQAVAPSSRFGMRRGRLIANLESYERLGFLCSEGLAGWRSGVKHDCSKVFELSKREESFVNGLGERVALEDDVVFPLLKSSDIARGRPPRKFVLIPHRSMDESPELLRERAPVAWRYLMDHSMALARRASSIYAKRPDFSIFGIGPYSFAPWKVAISGFYKNLHFSKLGPIDGRPVLLDDTCYFFPCDSEEECSHLHELVSSPSGSELLSSLVFWDSKRPVTASLLNTVDLAALGGALGLSRTISARLGKRQRSSAPPAARRRSNAAASVIGRGPSPSRPGPLPR